MSKNNIMSVLALLGRDAIAVEPNFANELLEMGQSGNDVMPTDTTVDAVTYKKYKNTATIFVDGAMYKKDIGGLCMSVASYDQIKSYIKQANADDEVEHIIFKVDTPGGSVAGVESLRQEIANSKKPTITIAENCLASAGMWAFTASNKIYANETTYLGSIGVIVLYKQAKDGEKTYSIVSKNAENKVCNMEDGSCKTKIQKQLDDIEEMFHQKLIDRFGVEKEKLVSDFDRGGVIFAKVAHKLGYIDDVKSYEEVIEELTQGSMATMPPDGKIVNQKQGKELAMAGNEDKKANTTTTDLQQSDGGIKTVEQSFDFEAYQERVLVLADENGITDVKVIGQMLNAKDESKAENIALKAKIEALEAQAPKVEVELKESEGAIVAGGSDNSNTEAKKAFDVNNL